MLERLSELWCEIGEEITEGVSTTGLTISQIKKQIKHSKNQLEIKMLNKKLNALYKKRT